MCWPWGFLWTIGSCSFPRLHSSPHHLPLSFASLKPTDTSSICLSPWFRQSASTCFVFFQDRSYIMHRLRPSLDTSTCFPLCRRGMPGSYLHHICGICLVAVELKGTLHLSGFMLIIDLLNPNCISIFFYYCYHRLLWKWHVYPHPPYLYSLFNIFSFWFFISVSHKSSIEPISQHRVVGCSR